MTIELREIKGGEVIFNGNGAGNSDLQVYRNENTAVDHTGDKIHISRKSANKEAICFVLNTGRTLFWVEHYLTDQEGNKSKVGERSRVLRSGEFIEFRPGPRITNVLSADCTRSDKI